MDDFFLYKLSSTGPRERSLFLSFLYFPALPTARLLRETTRPSSSCLQFGHPLDPVDHFTSLFFLSRSPFLILLFFYSFFGPLFEVFFMNPVFVPSPYSLNAVLCLLVPCSPPSPPGFILLKRQKGSWFSLFDRSGPNLPPPHISCGSIDNFILLDVVLLSDSPVALSLCHPPPTNLPLWLSL